MDHSNVFHAQAELVLILPIADAHIVIERIVRRYGHFRINSMLVTTLLTLHHIVPIFLTCVLLLRPRSIIHHFETQRRRLRLQQYRRIIIFIL